MPEWIRCRDPQTGHEFDVLAHNTGRGVEPIPGYPPNKGPNAAPRPAKHCTDKAGQPASPRPRKTRAAPEPPPEMAATPPIPEEELP